MCSDSLNTVYIAFPNKINPMSDIVVVGGGISGLSVAHFLSRMGFRPVVLEKEESVGGLGRWYEVNGLSVDSSYHIMFRNDVHIINLLNELGLDDDIVWNELEFVLDSTEGLLNFSPIKMLRSGLISGVDKVRLARMYIRLKSVRDWESMDKVSAKDWVVKNGGVRLYERVFGPIIESKWGNDSDDASAAWLFGRVKPRFDSRSLFGGSEKAGYLIGSFRRMFSALEKEITRSGGEIIKNANVSSMRFGGRKASVKFNEKEIAADSVVSTIPLPELVRIADLPAGFSSSLGRIRYKAFICTTFFLRRKLTDSFRTVFHGRNFPFGGIVELTNLVPPGYFNGHHILYVFHFLDESESMFSMSDAEVTGVQKSCLEKLYPGFSKDVSFSRICRSMYAEPFYRKGYLDMMPGIMTPLSNLFITGMVQSYPVSDYNSIIALSRRAAKIVGDAS